MGCARQVPGAMRPGRCVSLENHAAGVRIRVGAVSTTALGLPGSANDYRPACDEPEPTRASSGRRRTRGIPPEGRGAGELTLATCQRNASSESPTRYVDLIAPLSRRARSAQFDTCQRLGTSGGSMDAKRRPESLSTTRYLGNASIRSLAVTGRRSRVNAATYPASWALAIRSSS